MFLKKLYPSPASCKEDCNVVFEFGAEVAAVLSHTISVATSEALCELWHNFTFTGSSLRISAGCADADAALRVFSIGTPPAVSLTEKDSYALAVDAGGVCLVARRDCDLINGFMTLLQLLCPVSLAPGNERFRIFGAEIHDHSEIEFRAVHLCVFPDTNLFRLERAVRLAAFLKMSHLILEFWGTYRYECLPQLAWRGHSFTREQIKPIVDLATALGLEVIPMINHFGHAAMSRVMHGRHVALDNDPRLAMLFEPDGWTWCLSSKETYRLLSEMRQEMFELCGSGSYIHLGFDEAYSFATCPECRKYVPHKLLSSFLNQLTEDVAMCGRRPIVWHDELIARDAIASSPDADKIVANGHNHGTYKALDSLDRRIIIADWQYDITSGSNVTTPYFQERGFDTILCPWDTPANVKFMCQSAKDLGAYGVMLTTWHHLRSFLSQGILFGDLVWRGGDCSLDSHLTHSASILRSLLPTCGDYDLAGWNIGEIPAV